MDKKTISANQKFSLNLKELYHYKDLLYVLAFRDLKVRYAQTFLGLFWAFLQPLFTLLIFTLIFGRAIKVDTGTIPYPVFALAGMGAWAYFSMLMSNAGNSLIAQQQLVTKIYFPRLIIPLSKSLVGFVDFGITLLFLIVLMFYYGVSPSHNIIWLPVFLLVTIMAGLMVGIWLSALTIRYRDFQHVIPFAVQLGLYATPIAYPASLVPEKFLLYYYINPMAGIVEGFRWCIIGTESLHPFAFISIGITLGLFLTSLIYFKRVERVMADII